jgi:hypothetical protein
VGSGNALCGGPNSASCRVTQRKWCSLATPCGWGRHLLRHLQKHRCFKSITVRSYPGEWAKRLVFDLAAVSEPRQARLTTARSAGQCGWIFLSTALSMSVEQMLLISLSGNDRPTARIQRTPLSIIRWENRGLSDPC